MDRPNTISGLLAKRSELAGKIEHHQRTLNELLIDLDHLDHTIHLFAPDLELGLGKPKAFPPRHQAFRGGMQRFVLEALRTAQEPGTAATVSKIFR